MGSYFSTPYLGVNFQYICNLMFFNIKFELDYIVVHAYDK
jgi:hypothetical protein